MSILQTSEKFAPTPVAPIQPRRPADPFQMFFDNLLKRGNGSIAGAFGGQTAGDGFEQMLRRLQAGLQSGSLTDPSAGTGQLGGPGVSGEIERLLKGIEANRQPQASTQTPKVGGSGQAQQNIQSQLRGFQARQLGRRAGSSSIRPLTRGPSQPRMSGGGVAPAFRGFGG